MRVWALLALGALLLRRAAAASPRTQAGDVDVLARALVVEAADRPDSREWAGIAHVVLNRAEDLGSIRAAVVSLPGQGGKAMDYLGRLTSDWPLRQASWAAAQWFARAVLDGQVENPIGPRTQFAHADRFPACANAAECEPGRLCHEGRCRPSWLVPEDAGGAARHEPVQVGRATFAGVPQARWPISDPRTSLRELSKHLILLEEHLALPELRCRDCVGKHLLASEGYAEEAAQLDAGGDFPELPRLAFRLRSLWDRLRAGEDWAAVGQGVRAERKPLIGLLWSMAEEAPAS